VFRAVSREHKDKRTEAVSGANGNGASGASRQLFDDPAEGGARGQGELVHVQVQQPEANGDLAAESEGFCKH